MAHQPASEFPSPKRKMKVLTTWYGDLRCDDELRGGRDMARRIRVVRGSFDDSITSGSYPIVE